MDPLRPKSTTRSGKASPPPHRAALPRASSITRRSTRSSGHAAQGLHPRSSGSFEPLRDEDDDSAASSSPPLLSAPELTVEVATGKADDDDDGVATRPGGSPAADIDGANDTAAMASGQQFTQLGLASFSGVLELVSSRMELVSSRMDEVSSRMTLLDSGLVAVTATLEKASSRMSTLESTFASLHEEVKRNHGHVTKRLIAPLDARVAALEGNTARLEDDLAKKGSSLLTTVNELNQTADSLMKVVHQATGDFGRRLTALESRGIGAPQATPSQAREDPPSSDLPSAPPSAPFSPTPMDANANSHAAWARVHQRVTPPHVPVRATRNGPGLRQTTLPGAFHPRHSPIRGEGTFPHGSPDPSNPPPPYAPSPIRTHHTVAGTSGLMGGPITSPRNWDKETQARSLGASKFDVSRLACPAYHGGPDGPSVLTEDFIRECGFTRIKATADDVVICYNDIMYVHQKVRELWYNRSSNTLGPQIDKILQKSLSVFPRLISMDTGEVVLFYDRLQEISMNHLLALIPFDATMLQYRFEGLCPPGLGITRYGAMSKALMELLPHLIPGSTSPPINAALASVRYESNNGYDYLWRVLELTVPGFDPANSIMVPVWSGSEDIFSFAQDFLLYFRLQEKINFHFDDRRRSNIFLQAIQSSQFADTVTVLQSQVNSFRFEYDDGFLPPHLRLHGLATSIHQNTQARLMPIAHPRTHRVSDSGLLPIQDVPTSCRINRDDPPRRDNHFAGRSRDSAGHDNGPVRDDEHRYAGRTPVRAHTRGRPRPSNPGRLARPDRNRRQFLEGVQCAACGRAGHVAKQCDMLATAICIERYMKKDLSAPIRDAIEQEWLAKWKDRLGNPTSTPRQVMRTYVEALDITVASLDDAMDWSCWDDDDDDRSE